MSQEAALKLVKEHGGARKAARALNIPWATFSRWTRGEHSRDYKRYIITYAQNNTPIHQGFYQSIINYVNEWNAELICYRGRYRNPTSPEEEKKYEEWWCNEVTPYLMDTQRDLNTNLVIYPARTQPTAVNPLTGYETITEHKSGVFPHPKVAWETVATPGHLMPKILTTTGAITLPNYSKSKSGEKGQHHHIQGAVVVEIKDDKVFHLRHIAAEEDGSFYDVAGGKCMKYTPEGIEKRHKIKVLTFGDLHYPFVDWKCFESTKEVIKSLKPDKIVLHDCLDFWARNHHERGNRFLNAAKESGGDMSVENEIEGLAKTLTQLKGDHELLIVPSNHDEALDRWLQEESLDNLYSNATYFHWLSYNKHKSASRTYNGYSFFNTLEFALNEKQDLNKIGARCLKRDVPEIIGGVAHDMHGDIGPSGTRGNPKSISKIGVKSTIGHGHSPRIVNGCYMVGVKCHILGYAKGANSWLTTDCIQYNNGKRTFLTYVNGDWCL